MNLTFIEAASGTPLVKCFTAAQTVPYPNVVLVNSHEYHIQELQEFYELLQKIAPKGWAMLRGHFTKELRNESRRGQHDKSGLTRRITLDFDNVSTSISGMAKCDSEGVRLAAEQCMAKLPAEFTDCSYVATASSSFGTREDSVSLHVELLLDAEVSPVELKRYLQHLNFETGWLKDQITLSSNALALRWPLDVSVADNSKIIFIGTPVFDGVKNPFENDADRIVFVQKGRSYVNSAAIRAVDAAELRKTHSTLVKDLRRNADIRAKDPKTTNKIIANESFEVLTNVDKDWNLEIAIDDGDYVRANLNGGDSAAYWWPKSNPEYVFNFKSEPIFRMKDACPAFYDWYKGEYRDFILQSHGLEDGDEPVVFREPNEDEYYSMIYNSRTDSISRFAKISLASVENFMSTWGDDVPPVFPEYDLVFNPTTNTQFDAAARMVNKFRPTRYMKNFDLPKSVQPTSYGTCGAVVEKIAPAFFLNIKHVLGNSDREVEHFLNWLAFIMQNREKAGTAWILTGTTGTGKGLLFSMVIRKLFGDYAKTATTSTIEDDKNGYLEDCLFLFVDEFKESDSRSRSKTHNTLKNMVTEKHLTVRHMRQTAKTVRNYTNYMFSANYNDIMTITDDDRRFNVGTRQEVSLKKVYPQLPKEIDDDEQLMDFAAVLNTHRVEESAVFELIDNDARRVVQTASMNVMERFWHAVHQGELDFFVEFVLHSKPDNDAKMLQFIAAKKIVMEWLLSVGGDKRATYVEIESLRAVYNTLSTRRDPIAAPSWSQLVHKEGFHTQRPRSQNRRTSIEVVWSLEMYDKAELLAQESSDNVAPIDARRKKSLA